MIIGEGKTEATHSHIANKITIDIAIPNKHFHEDAIIIHYGNTLEEGIEMRDVIMKALKEYYK